MVAQDARKSRKTTTCPNTLTGWAGPGHPHSSLAEGVSDMQTDAIDPSLPPPLPSAPAPKRSPVRQLLAIVLSLCLGLFLADAVVSLADDSLILLFGIHDLRVMREMTGLFALAMAIVVYGLMGLAPMIPKRLFLPVTSSRFSGCWLACRA